MAQAPVTATYRNDILDKAVGNEIFATELSFVLDLTNNTVTPIVQYAYAADEDFPGGSVEIAGSILITIERTEGQDISVMYNNVALSLSADEVRTWQGASTSVVPDVGIISRINYTWIPA